MGEAKRRGSYEQRKVEGEARTAAKKQEQQKQELERAGIEALRTTEEQYNRRRAARLLAHTALAIGVSSTYRNGRNWKL